MGVPQSPNPSSASCRSEVAHPPLAGPSTSPQAFALHLKPVPASLDDVFLRPVPAFPVERPGHPARRPSAEEPGDHRKSVLTALASPDPPASADLLTGEDTEESPGPSQLRVLAAVWETRDAGVTSHAVAKSTGIADSNTSRILKALSDRGLVPAGNTKPTIWTAAR
jgi:hypothetical protein